jgi:protein-tyrosine phosphatase
MSVLKGVDYTVILPVRDTVHNCNTLKSPVALNASGGEVDIKVQTALFENTFVDDEPRELLRSNVAFIKEAVDGQGGVVVVQCFAGISRSRWLVINHDLMVDEAVELVNLLRPGRSEASSSTCTRCVCDLRAVKI